jgi:DMSO reductase anchor subunit
VPGAPAPGGTLPTTHYKTRRALARNLLPADFYALAPEHSHPALVAMLVLTQLSAGAFAVELWVRRAFGAAALGARTSIALFALALGVAALGASLLHLGRPRHAWRAVLGLRTSWLSREIVGFSLFAPAAAAYAASLFWPAWRAAQPLLGDAVAAIGVASVTASVMVYAATRRPSWRAPETALRFFATALVLGCATVAMIAAASGGERAVPVALCKLGAGAAAAKLLWEAAIFRHLRSRSHTALKRSAMLMRGDLARATSWRFVCGALGGVALPLIAVAAADAGRAPLAGLCVAAFALALVGELAERYLFFAAATALKMPGGGP